MENNQETVLGIIGGSGIYDIADLKDAEWRQVETPWGHPSDSILTGVLKGTRIAFLPRHGRGHRHTPTSVPYRANICAMKIVGVTDIVSLSACGSFREEFAPKDFVIVDQFIDRTVNRDKTFFGPGCVGHVSMANPTCERLSLACQSAAMETGVRVHARGTYLAMEGPQFSTLAESRLYRDVWKCDVIGMTNMPEAKLAREAEICYATVAMVTDYDSWHPDHGEVDIQQIISNLMTNSENAKNLVSLLAESLGGRRLDCSNGCDHALKVAILTAPEFRDPELVERLRSVAGRVLNR